MNAVRSVRATFITKSNSMAKTKRKSFFQISLRMMLVLVTLACLAFAYDRRFGRQHRAAAQLLGAKAKVTYHPSSVGWLPVIGEQLRDVQAVDLSHCRVDDESLQALLCFPRIERLYLARTNVDRLDLPLISRLRTLKRLALWGTGIHNRGFDQLAALQNLQALDVHDTRLSESALETFAKMPLLRELKYDFNRYSDRGLELLAEMPARRIGEVQCEKITRAGLQSLGKIDRNNYRITRLIDADIIDDDLLALANDQPLPVGPPLQVVRCPITDRVLNALPWDELTDVRFIDTSVTFDAIADVMGDDVRVFSIGERGYRLVKQWNWVNNYRWEPVGLSVWIEQDPANLTAEQLARLPNLESVYLDRKRPAGNLLVDLRNHAKITHFEMQSVPANTPVIEQISQWNNLQKAKINCCNPRTVFDISPLAKLQELRILKFSCTPFGDEAFETFGQLPELRELDMTSARNVKGPGLKHLQKLKHLQYLRVQSRANWDAAIEELMSLDHVKRITLIDVDLSKENLERFEAERWWSHLEWK